MKRIISLFLILLLIPVLPVSADEMFTVVTKDITVTYNGEMVSFPDAAPIIQNGKTLVPVRPIMERAKLTVDWDGNSRTVTAKNDELLITMKIDDTLAAVTEDAVTRECALEEPARIIKNRTYVPIRFLAESLGTKVNWNPNAREVVIIDTDEWKAEIDEESDFLSDWIDLPLIPQKPYTQNINGEFRYTIDAKSLITTDGTVVLQKEAEVYFVGTGVFDGNNTGYFLSVDTDLSALAGYFINPLTPDELKQLSGPCTLDFDIVIDKHQNLYIKSQRIKQLLTDLGRTKVAEALGDNYIKVPTAERYSEQELSALIHAAAQGKTRWDIVEDFIEKDNMLFTQSALLFDTSLAEYSRLYSKKTTRVSVPSKGAKMWELTSGETAHGETAMTLLKMLSAGSDFPASPTVLNAQKENLTTDNASVKTNLAITVKDDMVTRSRVTMKISTPSRAKNAMSLYINFGSSASKFDETTDKAISLPTRFISTTDLRRAAQQ